MQIVSFWFIVFIVLAFIQHVLTVVWKVISGTTQKNREAISEAEPVEESAPEAIGQDEAAKKAVAALYDKIKKSGNAPTTIRLDAIPPRKTNV